MGFYGNITNTSRTTFQFDKVYPSRKMMDASCREDGIYNGRYVLVEYDTNVSNSDYQKPWYIIKKPESEVISEEESGHNKIYAYAPTSAKDNSPDFVDLTTLKNPMTKAELLQGPSFIYLNQGHVFSSYNEEAKLIIFNKDGEISENSEDNLAVFNNFWTPLPNGRNHDDTLEVLKDYFIRVISEPVLNSLGIYITYVANGKARTATDIDWDEHPYIAGIVKPGCWYDYNYPDPEMWTLMPDNEHEYQEVITVEENGEEVQRTITYMDIQLSKEEEDTYTKNYNEDKTYYGNSRGYDSTVWQKVFVNGIEQYVMIAELNTVVPTFGITTDAPTLLPLNPHWGADSTNVYYDLHWQPQWGFRVKAANSLLTTQIIDPAAGTLLDEVNAQNPEHGRVYLRLSDQVNYPSDENITWENHFENDYVDANNVRHPSYYDSRTQTWVTDRNATVPAAIYYNKAGFDPEYIHYSTDLTDAETGVEGAYDQLIAESGWNAEKDFIGFSPTGLSGNLYIRHDGYYGKRPQVDTQEFSIMLPSIGNIIAKVWDMIYGDRELVNKNNNESTKINKRNMNIEWENGTKHIQRLGLRLRSDINGELYNTDAMKTLAGCINTAHDLFGMIIVPVNENTFVEQYEGIIDSETGQLLEHPDLKGFRNDRIYFVDALNTYCYKTLGYDFDPLSESDYVFNAVDDLGQLTNEIIFSGEYYVKIQKIIDDGQTQSVDDTTYVPVTSLLSMVDDDEEAGNQYIYKIETTTNNPQWVLEPNEFFENYTYIAGAAIHVKYYYRTVEDLYSTVDHPVKNFPYTIDGKTFNYVRESADGEIEIDDLNNSTRYNFYLEVPDEEDEELDGEYYCVTPGNPVDVSEVYQKNKYFYITTNSNGSMSIIRDNSETIRNNITYYEVDEEDFILQQNNLKNDGFPTMYLPGRYYYKNASGSYLLDWTIDGSDIKQYGEKIPYGNTYKYICYKKKGTYEQFSEETGEYEIYIENIAYEEVDEENFASIYLPNTYYVEDENQVKVLCTDLTYNSNKTYYKQIITYIKRTNDSTYNIDDVLDRDPDHILYLGDMSFYQDNTYFAIRRDNPDDPYMITEYRSLTVFDLTQQTDANDRSFNPEIVYFLRKKDQAETGVKYYSFSDYQTLTNNSIVHPIVNFYIPSKYHYKVGDNYIFAKDPDKLVGKTYYSISAISLTDYLQSKHLDPNIIFSNSVDLYYKDGNEYVKIEDYDENTDYGTLYTKDDVYVYNDSTPNADERLTKGTKWNVDALCIPDTIELARRSTYDTLRELPYYAVDKSTINGLILRNTRLIAEDIYTRDLDLVSGALNTVKDLIARFNRIRSQELTIVDNAGRIHSAPLDTWQIIGYENNEPIRKKWLTSVVDGDLASPKVILNHTYNYEGDTTLSTINMNDYDDPATQNVVEHNLLDRISISNPKIDEMGHVVGFNNREVIFPYCFGRIYLNSTASGSPLLEATIPNDYLIIKGDNWIATEFATDPNTSVQLPQLNITHSQPSTAVSQAGNIITGTDSSLTVVAHGSITLKRGDSFKVPYAEIDSTGHVVALKQDTLTLATIATSSIYSTINNQTIDNNVVSKQIITDASFGLDSNQQEKLFLNKDVAGSFPIGRVYDSSQYYNLGNETITLQTETTDAIRISNRLQQLTKTESYTLANTLGELTTINFQRTKWLTEILQIVNTEVNTLQTDLSDLENEVTIVQSHFTSLQNEVDSINVAIGNNTIYTPDDPETNENEQRKVTIQQLTSRVAQLEEVIRSLISVDENTNSLVVLSDSEIDEILDWDRITSDPTITVTFIHSIDNQTTQERDYLISDWVRRGHFTAYTGNDTAKYYVLDQDLQTYEEINLPFAITRAFVDQYGTMNINEDEGQITIIEALTTPSVV